MRIFLTSTAFLALLLSPLATLAASKTAFLFQPQRAAAQEEAEEEDFDVHDCVPPQELQGEMQMRNDQLRELKRMLKAKTVPAADREQLSGLNSTIQGQLKTLKGLKGKRCIEREVLDDLREENLWDQINELRRRIELPRELKTIERDLKDLDRILNRKLVQKMLAEFGGNLETIKAQVANRKDTLTKVRASLAGSSGEDVDELMEVFHEGGHPGEILGVLGGMEQFSQAWKAIKDDEIKEGLKAIIAPILESINNDDWREAREASQEIGPLMDRLLPKLIALSQKKRGNRGALLKNLEDLERKIEEKLGKEAPEQEEEGEGEQE